MSVVDDAKHCGTEEPERLRLEFWPVERLVPSPRNARTHSDAQIAEIAGSIRTFGFTNPILAGDDGDVIAGHGRLAAARLLGLVEVPVIVLRGLSDLQRRQLMLADNRIALNAGWDAEMLNLELQELSVMGADLAALGFTAQELAAALNQGDQGLTDENEVPEVAETAVAVAGDIWCLGVHRVTCGDCTDADTVKALLGAVAPILMVTDPPYGVAYDPEWRHRAGVNKSSRVGQVRNDERADWSAAWALFPGTIAYVWHGALHATTVAESLTRQGFAIRPQIIWAKERLVIGRGDYHWQHEPCWYAVRTKGHWTGDRKQTTLWTIPSGGQDAGVPPIAVNGIELYYESHGTGAPLVVLGGLGLDVSEMGLLTGPLAARFRVIAADNRGAGRSAKPPARIRSSRWPPTWRA